MKFSIGEFSRITSLSIKSLRLYHEKELLIPAEVDEFTKYRYYNETNYEKTRSIKILKEHDFSLAEIKEILNKCNDEADMLEQIQLKLSEVKNKIDRYNDISQSLENIINQEKESVMKTNQEFDVEEKEVSTVLIAGYRMKGKYQDVGEGFKLLGKSFGRQINGKGMNLYYDGEYKENDADFEPCFPIRKGKDLKDICVRELKGGKCVSLIHKGEYGTLHNSYKKLFSYINENKLKTLLPSREVYIKGPGMIFKGNPNNYLTEIQIMIGDCDKQ
ncbi:MAG: MerR family transcriptional regulator [Ignavibacteriae bacterium]|nr:MerR family transcriptional regulator [Ignavibacteriota bacterium]